MKMSLTVIPLGGHLPGTEIMKRRYAEEVILAASKLMT